MGELDTGPRPDTISYDDEIIGMTLKVTEVGIKISTTLPCSMLKKVWMALWEVDLGIGPELLPPII